VGGGAVSMFAGQPQPVEIHHRGIWYSGELIGWRHEANGRVAARVRCRVDGLRHSAWVDLLTLRLPDPKHPPRKERYPAVIPKAVTGLDEADATRPHAMLAGLSVRPARPAHAMKPPGLSVDEPGSDERENDQQRVQERHVQEGVQEPLTEAPCIDEPVNRARRNEQLHQVDAYFSVV
jgi:hypothetical protein